MASVGFLGYPLGVTFDPTDEELIEYYLYPKVHGCYADYGVVTDANVFELDPTHLTRLARYVPQDGSLYFFSPRTRSSANDKRPKRTRADGGAKTWKLNGKSQKIENRTGQLIGHKNMLEYSIGGTKTPWRIHEYKLSGIYQQPSNSSSDPKGKGRAASLYLDHVLCRLFFKANDHIHKQRYNGVAAVGEQQQEEEQSHLFEFEGQQQQFCSYSSPEQHERMKLQTPSDQHYQLLDEQASCSYNLSGQHQRLVNHSNSSYQQPYCHLEQQPSCSNDTNGNRA